MAHQSTVAGDLVNSACGPCVVERLVEFWPGTNMVENVNRKLYVDRRNDGDRAARVVKVLANVKFQRQKVWS